MHSNGKENTENDDSISRNIPIKKGPPKRDIAAPFQPTPRGIPTPRPSPLADIDRPVERIDYISCNFQELDTGTGITYEKYCGPTPESNWVIPGKLLVGAYPASQDDAETFELLTSILRLGVNQFICLQLEYKTEGVTEAMWRRGQALRPYFEDVKLLVKNKHMFKILSQDSNVCDANDLDFVHFPIKDCSVTDDNGVFDLALKLVEDINKGNVQYLHCWGGHGRTGTLVCIMLHLMYGMDAHAAMAYCQKVHDLRQCPVAVGSPQTQSQRDQVIRIIRIAENQESRFRKQQAGKESSKSKFTFAGVLEEEGGAEEASKKTSAAVDEQPQKYRLVERSANGTPTNGANTTSENKSKSSTPTSVSEPTRGTLVGMLPPSEKNGSDKEGRVTPPLLTDATCNPSLEPATKSAQKPSPAAVSTPTGSKKNDRKGRNKKDISVITNTSPTGTPTTTPTPSPSSSSWFWGSRDKDATTAPKPPKEKTGSGISLKGSLKGLRKWSSGKLSIPSTPTTPENNANADAALSDTTSPSAGGIASKDDDVRRPVDTLTASPTGGLFASTPPGENKSSGRRKWPFTNALKKPPTPTTPNKT
mmetsp:Transcript_14351/g.21503  ORF Transcript_14351/g.21503 Transcript_14351/m.21503 type:complete len:590 (-) Transcript_14351:312-2081(-)|eukprot:CAMPEP_0185034422 /NCGR_PEP_ID=MMETSP1103-20130426/24299_1 /TAXON_ID=36769 /ORGANISM="Paraphysomonas bandaiensis, Strain Caron Lab Isolate" /LENGTH=589 /DNA_ID=CAMNT_0027571069 /DNA_START=79 /DNA_END=1848 /DNA_ORIENTATION=+